MLNFIIYEDQRRMRDLYEKVILEFLGNKKDGYRIIHIPRFTENTRKEIEQLDGKKIYLLDIQVPGKSGFDLAREIRYSGDWLSQIIVISGYEHFKSDVFSSKTLTLDFISKDEDIQKRLRETLELAYGISTTHRFFSFQSNGEIFRIPYHDILYFSKELNDNYTSIVTVKQTHKVKKSISQIEKILGNDLRFLKTHQSCIINLHNVQSVDLKIPIINFGDKETNLLSREHRKELKERLTIS